MKKVFILFSAVCIGISAFAQSSSTINQSGEYNQADVKQTGGSSATIDQFSAADDAVEGINAEITQQDAGNMADIDQGNSSHNVHTLDATITQRTKNNVASISQGSNIDDMHSSDASIEQKGDNGNMASISQAKIPGKDWNTNVINNHASIVQDGKKNNATIESDPNTGAQYNTYSDIYQKGNNNSGKIIQNGERNFEAYIDQIGNNNVAIADQFGDANLVADIEQRDNGNQAYVTQKSSNNKTELKQSESSNVAEILQEEGKGNRIKLNQKDGSHAEILQHGHNNSLYGLGGEGTWAVSEKSTLELNQMGDNNGVLLNQKAGAATVNQMGNSNMATVNQY